MKQSVNYQMNMQKTIIPENETIPGFSRYRLSSNQQGLFQQQSHSPKNIHFNIPLLLKINHEINFHHLNTCINILAKNYRNLYLFIENDADNTIYNTIEPLPLNIHIIRDCNEFSIQNTFSDLLQIPFELNIPPLTRFYLITTERQSFLYIVYHHLVTDEFVKRFLDDLNSVYHQVATDSYPISLEKFPNFEEYVIQERAFISSKAAEKDIEYWKNVLSNVTPIDMSLLPILKNSGGSGINSYKLTLPIQTVQLLRSKQKASNVSIFTLFTSALFLLINKYTNQENISLSTVINNRYTGQFKNTLGDFSNIVVLQATLNQTHSDDFLRVIFKQILTAISHGRYPFYEVSKVLSEKYAEEIKHILNIGLVYHNYNDFIDSTDTLFSLTLEQGITQLSNQPFLLEIIEKSDELVLFFKYDMRLFSSGAITSMANIYCTILSSLASGNSLLKNIEYRSTNDINKLNGYPITCHKKIDIPCVHTRFELTSIKNPFNTAIQIHNNKMTYCNLNKKSNQLARYLLENFNITNNTIIAIYFNKSIESIVCMLAILKSGAAYLPLDPSYPIDRIQYMLTDTNSTIIITKRNAYTSIKDKVNTRSNFIFINEIESTLKTYSETNIYKNVSPDSIANVIYTSGTTGKPNGVLVTHQGISNLAASQGKLFGISTDSSVLQFASLSFDASTSEIWSTLLNGGKLCLPFSDLPLVGNELVSALHFYSIDILTLPPSILSSFDSDSVKLITLIVAGESASQALLDKWITKVNRLINAYGPTESTVCASMKLYQNKAEENNIGTAIDNNHICILDSNLMPCPIGIFGEIYISGIGLARGYLNNSELTNEKFRLITFNNKKMLFYKSGDKARYLENGDIEFRCRIDTQIKLRGYRIELEEIESLLKKDPGIISAAVTVTGTEENSKLVAFVVPKDFQLAPSNLTSMLSQHLPKFMVPSQYIMISALPLNSNGKIDRKKLILLDSSHHSIEIDSNKELSLFDQFTLLCAEVLNIDSSLIDLKKDFFQLGGNSLSILKLISKINKTIGINIPMNFIFEADSLLQLFEYIQNKKNPEQLKENYIAKDLTLSIVDNHFITVGPENFSINTVFLTGSTGFLGIHLLFQLLKLTSVTIYCLVRSNSTVEALDKITSNLKYYHLEQVDLSRIKILLGNLELPEFGFKPEIVTFLSTTIDAIYHCGADVNHIYPYDKLRATNVLSTHFLLKLASSVKLKRIHYISTIDTITSDDSTEDSEDKPLDQLNVNWGYIQSKWVSEKILFQSGVPITIYRPGNISGNSQHGICNPHKNHALILLRTCVQSGLSPTMDTDIEMTPVDHLSNAIISISMLQTRSNRLLLNMHNPHGISWIHYMDMLNRLGYPIKMVDFAYWRNNFLASLPEHHGLYIFKQLYEEKELDKLKIKPSVITRKKTNDILTSHHIEYRVDYYSLISIYMNYLEKIKFFQN